MTSRGPEPASAMRHSGPRPTPMGGSFRWSALARRAHGTVASLPREPRRSTPRISDLIKEGTGRSSSSRPTEYQSAYRIHQGGGGGRGVERKVASRNEGRRKKVRSSTAPARMRGEEYFTWPGSPGERL